VGILVNRPRQAARRLPAWLLPVLFSAATLSPCPAQAKGDGDIWSVGVAFMCWAQDPAYRESSFGTIWARSAWFPGWETFDRRPETQCFRKTRWASDALCAELMQLDEKGLSDLDPLYKKYKREIRGMENAFEYMNKQSGAKGELIPCPEKRVDAPPDREALEAGALLKSFGLEGRWAANCADKAENATWTVFAVSPSGRATTDVFFVLRTGPELVRSVSLVSARLLPDERIELNSRQEYPEQKLRYSVIYRKTVTGLRVMQSSGEEADATTEYVKDGILLKNGKEMPTLTRCADN